MKRAEGFPANLRDSSVALADRIVREKRPRPIRATAQVEPSVVHSRLLTFSAMLASGLCIAIAWFITETIASAVLG
jgi:hypothetical protein